MVNRFLVRSSSVLVLAAVGLTLSCGGGSPAGPSATPAPLTVRSVSPSTGLPDRPTVVTVFGSGFQAGATVGLGGAATGVTVNSSTTIVATAPAHDAGAVDVVVTNPNGQSSTLAGGFTYAVAPAVPGPVVTAITPGIGSSAGGVPVTITGTGFRGTGYQSGVVVTLGDVVIEPYYANGTSVFAEVPAHAPGQVDVVVTNIDGQTARLAGGFTFVLPQSLDFNGKWAGDGHDAPAVRFTIQNNMLISVGCGASPDLTLSPPLPVNNGEFSFSREDGVAVTGRIVSPSLARGMMNLPPCPSSAWFAEKDQG